MYRPMPMPLPLSFPVVKREPLQYYRPESPPAVKRDLGQQVTKYAPVLAIIAVGIAAIYLILAVAFEPEPRLFVRLVAAEGLDSEPREQSPLFKLAVDVDMVPNIAVHVGGGGADNMLRVSYRGVILAWGAVPRFEISRQRLLGQSAAGVVTVVTTAQGSVLREDMRKVIRAEWQALGRVEFEADGDIPGLGGHLHCKFYLAGQDQPVEGLRPPCLVQKNTASMLGSEED